jgi:beta-phosphoglucomutase-like phosphatase (HAD superfamily)
VLLDFDGVMFDVRGALGQEAREQAITAFLNGRPHRPRSLFITFAWVGVHQVLAYLAEHEPDYAVDAEALVSKLELGAALTAAPVSGLDQVLAACASTGRSVAVISGLSELAVLATVQARGGYGRVRAVAARQGLDLSTVEPANTIERAAELLDIPLASCLVVSGQRLRLRAAQHVGAIALGCECRRDPRKHLADYGPVVPNLATLVHALLTA